MQNFGYRGSPCVGYMEHSRKDTINKISDINKTMTNTICKIMIEKDDAKKKGWVWESIGHVNKPEISCWCRVIDYEFLKQTSMQNPNKYNDKCRVVLQNVETDSKDKFTKHVFDYNGDYFKSYKIYIRDKK